MADEKHSELVEMMNAACAEILRLDHSRPPSDELYKAALRLRSATHDLLWAGYQHLHSPYG